MNNENEIEYVSPFKKFCITIGNLPTAYIESMSYYEGLTYLVNYLSNNVIPTVNNNSEVVEELQNLFEQLESFVDNYFENLDVQEEINQKLDEMARNGQLTSLIKDYIDPIFQEYTEQLDEDFNNYKIGVTDQINAQDDLIDAQNANISNIENRVNSIASGNPLAANSVADMTDTSRIYVNTSDGYWYYFDGNNWTQGGVYMSDVVNSDVFGITTNLNPGFITNTGSIDPQSTSYYEVYTDKINVVPGNKLKFSISFAAAHSLWIAYVTYSDDTFKSRSVIYQGTDSSYSGSITVPAGINKIAFTFRTFNLSYTYSIENNTNYNEELNKIYYTPSPIKVLSGNQPLNYNTSTQILTISRNTTIICPELKNSNYAVPNNTDITLDLSGIASSAVYVLFNTDTKEFVAKSYNGYQINKSNEVLFCTVRKQNGSGLIPSIDIGIPYSIDNVTYGKNDVYPTAIIGGNGDIVFDTTFNTLTIPADTLIVSNRSNGITWTTYYSLINSETVITLDNTVALGSSAINVFYNVSSQQFEVVKYDRNPSNWNNVILFCSFRRKYIDHPYSLSCNFPYVIDGNKYDVVDYSNPNFKSVAHRGYSTVAPENTLPAYKLARKMGFRYVETDVQFTLDNVPVLLHDLTIDRTSNGTGSINSLTYDQVKNYDFGSWKNSIFSGTKIPKFEEFLQLCKRIGLYPYIEIKNDATYTQAQIELLVDIVNDYGMKDKVTWISFNPGYLTYIKNYDDKARLGIVCGAISATTVTQVNSVKTDNNEVFIDTGDITNIDIAKDENIPVEYWTIDSATTLNNADPYISGITTNSLNANKVWYDSNI